MNMIERMARAMWQANDAPYLAKRPWTLPGTTATRPSMMPVIIP